MMSRLLLSLVILVAATAAADTLSQPDLADLASQVRKTETAFAKTMADRDHAAFASFLSVEAVFMNGKMTLRGKQQVADAWKKLYDGPDAAFSWEPEHVEVLDSGTLAFSSGPIRNPEGKRMGTFHSIWRLEADGEWRIVFDRGCPPCKCE